MRRPSSRALLGTIVGSAPGFILPFATTGHFGVGRLSDAYFFGLALATFVALVYEGVLQANVTPVLQADKLGGAEHFRATTRRVMVQASVAALLSYALVGGVGGVLAVNARSNWTPTERHTALVVIALLTFYVLASTATAILASGLYALQDFFFPLGSTAMRSLTPLVGLLFLGHGAGDIELFALLLCVGELARGLILARRLFVKSRPLAVGRARETVGVWKTGIPHAASLVVAIANPLVDRFFAAPLGTGAITVLELGEKILYAPLTALTSFFVLVAGVRWTEQSFDDGSELGRDFRRTMLRAMALATFAAALVAAVVLAISFLSGSHFAGARTSRLLPVVLLLLLGLPGGLMIALGSRLLSATRRTRILPVFAVVALTVNVIGDFVGSRLWGLNGIALGSTVVRYGNTLLYLVVCARVLRGKLAPGHAIADDVPPIEAT